MKRGRKVFVGILLFGIIMISLSIVSAGIFDFLKLGSGDDELEGELDEKKFEATVNLLNAPPLIVAFRPADDFPDGALNPGVVQPVPDGVVTAKITFIVEDANIDADDDLPGMGAYDIVTGDVSGSGNVFVQLTSPANSPNQGTGSQITYDATTCVASPCSGNTDPYCDDTTEGNYLLQMKYVCDVPMNYYDEKALDDINGGTATSKDDFWTIHAEIKDAGGSINEVDSGDTANGDPTFNFDGLDCGDSITPNIGKCDVVEYGSITFIDTGLANVAWGGIDVVTATDQPADDPLVLSNFGNMEVASVDIQGKDLTGANDVNKILEVEAFSTSDTIGGPSSGACTGQILEADPYEFVTSTGVLVPYTASGKATDTEDMFFCIYPILQPDYLENGLDTSYSATVAKGNNWEIDFVG